MRVEDSIPMLTFPTGIFLHNNTANAALQHCALSMSAGKSAAVIKTQEKKSPLNFNDYLKVRNIAAN